MCIYDNILFMLTLIQFQSIAIMASNQEEDSQETNISGL